MAYYSDSKTYKEGSNLKEHNLEATGGLNSNTQRGSLVHSTGGSAKKPKNVTEHVEIVDVEHK